MMEKKYYRNVMSAFSIAEYWRLCSFNLLVFPLAIVLFKIFRMRGDVVMAQALIDDIIRVPEDDIPPAAKKALAEILSECERAGLSVDCFYKADIITADVSVGVLLVSPDKRVSYQIILGMPKDANLPTTCFFTCYSSCSDGQYVITSGGKRQLDSAPCFDVEYLTGKPVQEILQRHRARVESRTNLRSMTQEEIGKDIAHVNNLTLQHLIEQGKVTEMSVFEVTELKRKLGYYR